MFFPRYGGYRLEIHLGWFLLCFVLFFSLRFPGWIRILWVLFNLFYLTLGLGYFPFYVFMLLCYALAGSFFLSTTTNTDGCLFFSFIYYWHAFLVLLVISNLFFSPLLQRLLLFVCRFRMEELLMTYFQLDIVREHAVELLRNTVFV